MTPSKDEKRLCLMCVRSLAGHPACRRCTLMLEPELNQASLCRCGKFHNAPSRMDGRYCRKCRGEPVPTGQPEGEPPTVEEEINELIET